MLTHDWLDELVPIDPAAMRDRQVIEWDKGDIDALRFMKVDWLALGILSSMKCGLDMLAEHKGIRLDLATVPAEDAKTYATIRKADTLGTFQIESGTQMSMLPQIKPRTFNDLVIEVAIVRLGPIQGDMVHPYLRRREGKEAEPYASIDDLRRRAGIPAASLVQLAEADAFRPSLQLARREALQAIKALRDESPPLFVAASVREAKTIPNSANPR